MAASRFQEVARFAVTDGWIENWPRRSYTARSRCLRSCSAPSRRWTRAA